MTTVALDSLYAELSIHVEHCELGWRLCLDCRFARDIQAQSAITVALSEVSLIESHLRRYPSLCVYCADTAQHRDHLVPEPWTGPIARRRVPTVPSCADCNTRVNDAPIFTIAGRCEVIAASLKKKKRKDLAIADHDPEWFDEFSPRMAANLYKMQLARRSLRLRVIVLEAPGAAHVPTELLYEITEAA